MMTEGAARERLLRDIGLLVTRCSACGNLGCSGFISYGRASEPHCLACCQDWECRLRTDARRRRVTSLYGFRIWQASRRAVYETSGEA